MNNNGNGSTVPTVGNTYDNGGELCMQEIIEVLARHNCSLVTQTILQNGVTVQHQIIAVPNKKIIPADGELNQQRKGFLQRIKR